MKRNSRLISAGSIKSDSVKSIDGKDIGNIEELMIDLTQGKIEYAVLSFGGIMGLGDKYFAVPWSALEVDQTSEVLRLDVDKEQLRNAPGFDKNNWPDFADSTFLNSVSKTYSGVGRHTYMEQ